MTIRQFIRGIIQLAREGNELFQLQENVVYLQSVGGGFTYFEPGLCGVKENWATCSHHEGPGGKCCIADGHTLTESVAALKTKLSNYKIEREKYYVN